MVASAAAPGWRIERRHSPRDLQMLQLCSSLKAYWTGDLALRGNVRGTTFAEAYRLLVDLERRRLIRRVVCQESDLMAADDARGDLVATYAPSRSF